MKPDVGFGELTFVVRQASDHPHGEDPEFCRGECATVTVDMERMNREFLREVLVAFAEWVEIAHEGRAASDPA